LPKEFCHQSSKTRKYTNFFLFLKNLKKKVADTICSYMLNIKNLFPILPVEDYLITITHNRSKRRKGKPHRKAKIPTDDNYFWYQDVQ